MRRNRQQALAIALAVLTIGGIVAPTVVADGDTAQVAATASSTEIPSVHQAPSAPAGATHRTTGESPDSESIPDAAPEVNATMAGGNPKVASSLTGEGASRPDSFGLGDSGETTGDTVTVLVRATPGQTGTVVSLAQRYGEVRSHNGRRVVLSLPREDVTTLANHDAVGFIRRPVPAQTYDHVTSEGVETMNATDVQNRTYTGENVTVAVIDYGFNVSNPEIADNVNGTKEFSSGFSSPFQVDESTYPHGTATTELVVDTAPNVSIITVAVGPTTSMENAMQWIANNSSIDAVSMSVGPLAGYPLDGSSQLSQEMDDVVASGKPVFMSAGNEADGDHWNGTWQDGDGDGYLNFTATDETMGVGSGDIDVYVQWNDWPDSNEDYDVYLINSSGTTVASSTTTQDGSQPPVERITYAGSTTENYALIVKNVSANGTSTFNIFVRKGGPLEHPTAEMSLVVPATGRNVTAVAAMDDYDEQMQAFSSQGPTVDGRQKPEITAPDNVTTTAYAPRNFPGTSAAAPHAAGSAALLLDATNGSLSASEVTAAFTETAVPVTGTEPNNESGHGLVDANASLNAVLPSPTPPVWPNFGYDQQRTGYAPRADGPRVPVDARWTFASFGDFESSPAVVNGTVFVGSSGDDNRLYAIDAWTGEERWNYSTGSNVESSPAVDNGTVYVGSDDNAVYALNATTGAEEWNYTTGDDVKSSPVVVNGTVYVASWDKNVYALNASTGNKIWNYTTGGPVSSSPAVANGTVYIGSAEDNNVYALNATTGSEKWNYTTGGWVGSTPAVSNGTVYVGSGDNSVYALNALTGSEKWNYTTSDSVLTSPAVADGVVYVGSADHNVYALNASSGAEVWNYTAGNVLYSPAVADETVYVGSRDDNVYALNATSGEKRWNYSTGSVKSSPAVVNGTVYLGSLSNNMYALAPEPTAAFSAPDRSTVGETVTLEAGSSTVPAGEIVRYEWDLDNDGAFDTKTTETAVEHSFNRPGGYSVTLRVTTDKGVTDTVQHRISVVDPTERTPVDEWSQFRLDDNNTGHNPDATGIVGEPWTRWQVEIGEYVYSSPAVVGDTAYVGVYHTNDTKDGLYALNTSTGATEWHNASLGNVFSSPAVTNGTVYVGNVSGGLFAVDASTGDIEWRFQIKEAIQSSPVVVNGTVYVGASNSRVYAINASDGTKTWSFETTNSVVSSPAVVNGTVYVGDDDGVLHALNASTGAEVWNFTTGGTMKSTPVVASDKVYVGTYGESEIKLTTVYALNASTGAEQWNYSTDVRFGGPAVAGGRVYVGADNGNVYALDASDGSEAWNYSTGARIQSSPAVVNDTVYVGSNDNAVYALNASTGTEAWNYTTGDFVWSSPAVVGDRLYVGSGDGSVYALEGTADTSPNPSTASDTTVAVDETVTFNASDSTDDTGIVAYEWDFDGDGRIDATGPTASTSYGAPGTYAATLTVVDHAGHSASATRTITVEDRTSPVAAAGSNKSVETGQSVSFDGSASSDNVGVKSYQWDFGDGSTASGPSVSYTYDQAGTYTVTLTVRDAAGNTDTDTLTVDVTQASTGGGGSGGGGGGGGGGGQAGSTQEMETDVVQTDRGETLVVRNARSGSQAVAEFGSNARSEMGAVTRLAVQPTFSESIFRVAVTAPSATATGTPELSGAAPVGYFEVQAIGLSNERITSASIRFAVTSLPAGATAEQVRLYRYHDGAWQELETSVVSEGVYEAQTPGFSAFAIGIAPAESQQATTPVETTTTPPETASPETTPTERTQSSPSADSTDDDEGATETSSPGFGLLAALVALATLASLARRRE